MSKKTIAIIGPTASGKSDAAIAIARAHGGAVIGADSRQVYRHMDLGSGKEPGTTIDLTQGVSLYHSRTGGNSGPSTKYPLATLHTLSQTELLTHPYISAGVPHYMIDVADPTEDYSAGRFAREARAVMDALHAHAILPIVCGGTHFWVQALLENTPFAAVPPDDTLRRKLAALSCDELLSRLEACDARRAADIVRKNEQHNRHRLIRAIEICTALGYVPSAQSMPPDPHTTLIVAIIPPMAQIEHNIIARLQPRLDAGMLEEVRTLHDTHRVSYERLEHFGLEYKWCALLLQEKCTLQEMRNGIIRESRQFAKRQITWIRRWQKNGARIHTVTTPHAAHHVADTFLAAHKDV